MAGRSISVAQLSGSRGDVVSLGPCAAAKLHHLVDHPAIATLPRPVVLTAQRPPRPKRAEPGSVSEHHVDEANVRSHPSQELPIIASSRLGVGR